MAAPRPDSPPSAADILRIERIGAEGDGIAHGDDGVAIYVPRVLPGETVRVGMIGPRGDGRVAKAETILDASPDRVEPPCPHFGACGGCALQHWQMAPYLEWKSSLLAAALRRAGYTPSLAPIVPTPPGARRRFDFAIRRDGPTLRIGLHGPRSTEIVDLRSCPVLHPDLAALLAPLRSLIGGLGALRRGGSLIANLLESGPDLLLRTDGALTTADRTRLAAFAARHAIARIAWARRDDTPETACLLRPAIARLGDVAVTPPPGAFLQASREGETAIVASVLAGLPAKLPARARVAELYAGSGTLTFPLARQVRVAAFEGDRDTVTALTAAVNANGLTGRIAAQHRDLTRQPLSAQELASFAAVVLDPPFAGAAVQVGQIAASKVACVIYVSCNPAVLARDAAMLRAAGYALRSATPIDQFLWSPRLESVSVFAR